jgi:hypothetical protein
LCPSAEPRSGSSTRRVPAGPNLGSLTFDQALFCPALDRLVDAAAGGRGDLLPDHIEDLQ